MSRPERIIEFLSQHPSATGKDLREHLGITRQALSVHLRRLVAAGEVVRSGNTRGAVYSLASRRPEVRLKRSLSLRGLDEGEAYELVAASLNLGSQLVDHVEAILRYAFTEMLNNAIDHSGAETCQIELALDRKGASFGIRDRGAGVFKTIATKLRLEDEQAAMIELIKGRTTTMPEAHTGEGLFFTSRVADRFVLRSHRIELEWDRQRDDVFVRQRRLLVGTQVRFLVGRSTQQRLEAVFSRFAPAEFDYQFLRTQVHVKLLRKDYVSRSEAKRLLTNLERFLQIELDFRDVVSVGQGFADEVFRVFRGRHPQIEISARNADAAVSAMLRHAGWDGR